MSMQIQHSHKLKHLASLSEDDFRDRIVYPLFKHQNARHYTDNCGHHEEGKDCFFTIEVPLSGSEIWAVQTKATKLDLTQKNDTNLVNVLTQLRTALDLEVALVNPPIRQKPAKVFLFNSKNVSQEARNYLHEKTSADPRLNVKDANEIVDLIDQFMPEYWENIDPWRFPYFRQLRQELLTARDVLAPLGDDPATRSPLLSERYVDQSLMAWDLRGSETKAPFKIRSTAHLHEDSERVVFLVGEAGAGKTTALRRMAYLICERSLSFVEGVFAKIPVYLRASEIIKFPSILDAAESRIRDLSPFGHFAKMSAEDITSGRLIIFFDSLEEIHDDVQLDDFFAKLDELRRDTPRVRAVIATRDSPRITRKASARGITTYEVLPLDISQTKKLVTCTLRDREVPPERASECLRRITQVHGMTLNPLLVVAYAASEESLTSDMPPNISEILVKFTSLLLGQWDTKKSITQQYEWRIKDWFLCHLAYTMHSDYRLTTTEDEIRSVLVNWLSEKALQVKVNVLFSEIVGSGILIFEDGEFRFRHRLLQEFFAGRSQRDAALFQTELRDEWWRNPCVFYFGQNSEDEDGLAQITNVMKTSDDNSDVNMAMAVGLSCQAAYMCSRERRLSSIEAVLDKLAHSLRASYRKGMQYPLTRFIYTVLSGKDAIGSHLVELLGFTRDELDDEKRFWLIVGLIESGNGKAALEYLKGYEPSRSDYLFGVYILSVSAHRVYLHSGRDHESLKEIQKKLAPKVVLLRNHYVKEMKSVFAEIRQGRIEALEEVFDDGDQATIKFD